MIQSWRWLCDDDEDDITDGKMFKIPSEKFKV